MASATGPELRLRARQLSSRQERLCLAHSLEVIIAETECRTDRSLYSLALPIHHEAVSIWRDSLLGIAHRLETPGPVAAAGMARLRLLLTDGAGPLFNPSSEYLLADTVPRIEAEL